jgi:hypothetical protein
MQIEKEKCMTRIGINGGWLICFFESKICTCKGIFMFNTGTKYCEAFLCLDHKNHEEVTDFVQFTKIMELDHY